MTTQNVRSVLLGLGGGLGAYVGYRIGAAASLPPTLTAGAGALIGATLASLKPGRDDGR